MDDQDASHELELAADARLHFVGIGGAGMSGVARYALATGHRVSGSDLRPGATSRALSGLGARVVAGHASSHVDGVDAVVVSSAVPPSNVEVVEARERGIPVVRRGELLAHFVAAHPGGIAICGTHGKGTTSGALVEMLEAAEIPVSYVLGAPRRSTGRRARHTADAAFFVAEVDESDRTHLHHRPAHLLVNNLEADHLDVYGDLDGLVETFETLLGRYRGRTRSAGEQVGHLVLGTDGLGMERLRARLGAEGIDAGWSAGLGTDADVSAHDVALLADGRARYEVVAHGTSLGGVESGLRGELNVRNLIAASAMALGLEVPWEAVAAATRRYAGLVDRFHEFDGPEGRLVVTDYTSHPTSMAGNLSALRARRPDARLVAVFQPYRYSLLNYHWDRYASALAAANLVCLAPLDPCGETPPLDRAITNHALAAAIEAVAGSATEVVLAEDLSGVAATVKGALRPGDAAIVFGGGPLFTMAREIAGAEPR